MVAQKSFHHCLLTVHPRQEDQHPETSVICGPRSRVARLGRSRDGTWCPRGFYDETVTVSGGHPDVALPWSSCCPAGWGRALAF